MQTVKDGKKSSIKPIFYEKVDADIEKIVTDGNPVYQAIIPAFQHEAGNHRAEQKARKPPSNQTIEGVFSLFKRGIVGSYHKLGTEHLDRYLGEFCWRYNRRGVQPWMFEMALLSAAENKPLPYKELTKF